MSNPHGTPIWYELMTPDPDAAQAFYASVIGWSYGSFEGAPTDYRIISAPDGDGVGGIMKSQAGMPTDWVPYIGVDDVDVAAEKISGAGGTVHMPPTTMDQVGRLAMVADPSGVLFYLMKGASPEPSTAFKRMSLGHGEWNEIYATDDAAALAFYDDQFGWKKDGAMPMGEMGDYSFLSHHGGMIGALMRVPPGQTPRWNSYFRVGQIDEAKERIEAGGGKVTWGPDQVPGGDWVIVAEDPQGIRFGVVGSR